MRTNLISASELTERDLAEWRELAAQAVEPNPFYEPEYVLPLAKAVGQGESVRILTVQGRDGWRAYLPVHAGRWHRLPGATFSWRTWTGYRQIP